MTEQRDIPNDLPRDFNFSSTSQCAIVVELTGNVVDISGVIYV